MELFGSSSETKMHCMNLHHFSELILSSEELLGVCEDLNCPESPGKFASLTAKKQQGAQVTGGVEFLFTSSHLYQAGYSRANRGSVK